MADLTRLIDELRGRLETQQKLAEAISVAIKKQHIENPDNGPSDEVQRCIEQSRKAEAEYEELEARILEQLDPVERSILEAHSDAVDKLNTETPRWFRRQVEKSPATDWFEDRAPQALKKLLATVDPQWLEGQATFDYRLGPSYLAEPLQLIAGLRLPSSSEKPPQRLARMLLVTQDHLRGAADLDFFHAPTLVAEATALGERLELIPNLGNEATQKFDSLARLTDDEIVASTIFELAVGTACVKKGLQISMLPSSPLGKSPDFRLHGFGIPIVIECKRRRAFTDFDITEASAVSILFNELHRLALAEGAHGIFSISFTKPVNEIRYSSKTVVFGTSGASRSQ